MKLTVFIKKCFLIALTIFSIVSSKTSVAQNYMTINDLYNLSTSAFSNVYDIKDFANAEGYYSSELQGKYKDDYGNEFEFYKFMDRVYMSYTIKATPNAIKIFEDQIKKKCYFDFNSDDGKLIFYRSPNGQFRLVLEKTPLTWHFSVSENRKGDRSPAYEFEKSKIEVNSYTDHADVFIKKGDKIYLKATGTVKYGSWTGSGGPEGIDGFGSFSTNTNFKHGSLLGKIGQNGEWFLIGSYKTLTATISGKLFIMINDNDPSNNEGGFDVEYGINKEIKPN